VAKFSDLPPKSQLIALAAMAVLLAGALFYYFVWPLSAQIDALQKQVNDLHAQNARNKIFEQEHAQYVKRIAEAQAQLESLRSMVPDEPATDEFVHLVHGAATESAIHLRTFIADPTVARDLYTEMPFHVRIDGTYYQLRNFFVRLTQAERIVGVTNLTLGPPAGGGKGQYTVQPDETVGANCVVKTYFKSARAPAAQSAAPPAKR
jgi:type IV pilus assembly protein PilO